MIKGNRYKQQEIKIGTNFNNWTILKEVNHKPGHSRRFLCKNSDGIEKIIMLNHLKSGASRGIAKKEISQWSITHGMSKTRQYNIWRGMIARCFNTNEPAYKNYGKRGITVCDKWMYFSGFWEDMSINYKNDSTIERINVNGNYCKENCKWIPKTEQSKNRRSNIIIEYNGEKRILFDWSKILKIPYDTLYNRINRYKMSVDDAFKKVKYIGKLKRIKKII